jgi:hypothetical protein
MLIRSKGKNDCNSKATLPSKGNNGCNFEQPFHCNLTSSFSQHNNIEYLKKLTNENFTAFLRRSKGNNLFNDMIDSFATLLNITHLNRDVQYWLVVGVKGESPLIQILNLETYHQLQTNLDEQKNSRQ